MNQVLENLYNWQSFVGAIIGAATPIIFWFFAEWYRDYKKYKENLLFLEKFLVFNINTVISADKTIRDFITIRLAELISHIDQNTATERYSADEAFFPLLMTSSDDIDFLSIKTKSGYLDNKIMQVSMMSRDFSLAVEDMRRQFTHTVSLNQDMAFNKRNPPNAQNALYKGNIQGFIEFVNRDFFEKSLKVYIKTLSTARVAVSSIREEGFIR